jgi:hypothetical protein
MNEDRIIKIYNKRLKKYNECSYGAFLKNWNNYGWAIVNTGSNPVLTTKIQSYEQQ